jgi:misacylated tRNA(Ala) deacylase
MTTFVFRDDSYLKELDATITAVVDGGVMLDRTIFYATSGGQPGDTGALRKADGTLVPVTGAIHPDGDKTEIVHLVAPEAGLAVGDKVTALIDFDTRLKLMRMHTALHLLSVAMPFPVTGGQVGAEKGRLDFDMPELPADLAAIETWLNEAIKADHKVTTEWITDDEMAANPGLIKTMKVKPPMGQGRVRLVRIGDVDLQPCGGTHVASTAEIGPVKLGKIEKKGAINRRVSLLFA